ncbi:MAG: dihydropyrimidinase [Chloroflexi bacterium]|nr:MAG: dihydropyrimidinase [Chloroflexota bacterium]
MYDLVIRGGTVINSTGIHNVDIGIQNGTIIEMAPGLSGREQIIASGYLVLPGGVDPHVHLEMQAGVTSTSDTWETGSRAAAFGGTTTIIDFVEPYYSSQPLMEAFNQRLAETSGKAAVDFGFHMTLCDANQLTLKQIPAVAESGMHSFKVYTTYEDFHLKDPDLLTVFRAVREAGGMVIVHAESDAIIQDAVQRLRIAGRLDTADFPESRPAIAEKEAIERVLTLANYTGTPVYIVHISTAAGAKAVDHARNGGQEAWGETCPQYLLLDDTCIKSGGFEGAKFVCCPPIRSRDENTALWSALKSGQLHTIGTDHCAFNFQEQKEMGRDSFLKIPPGLPGIELRLALIYTYGVRTGLLSLNQFVDLCCTSPARLFGLYPKKGDLIPGADADIVLFDPNHLTTITQSILHENVDYTPYEGLQLEGRVHTTILRGRVLVRNGEWAAESSLGEYQKC